MGNAKELLNRITCFVFDVDGVLTNGELLLLPSGDQARKMYIRDGYALQLAVKNGYQVIVISGGKSEGVRDRLKGLGISEVYLGVDDKREKLREIMMMFNLKHENILYMGDDIPDLAAMKYCALPCCPADAAPEIKEISLYISDRKGGEGCVRDIIEQTLRLHNKWNLAPITQSETR